MSSRGVLVEDVEPLLDVMWHFDCVVSLKRNLISDFFTVRVNNGCCKPARSRKEAISDCIPSSNLLGDTLHTLRCPEISAAQASAVTAHPVTSSVLESSTAGACGNTSNLQDRMVDVSTQLHNPISGFTVSEPEKQCLQKVFETFDENRDGMISKDELVRSLEKLGICMPTDTVESLLYTMPLKVADYLDLDEFLLLYQTSCGLTEELYDDAGEDKDKDLREAFSIFDKNRDGFISPYELQEVLCCLGFHQAEDIAACEEMIKHVDEDHNGQVDFSEFKKMMCLSLVHVSC